METALLEEDQKVKTGTKNKISDEKTVTDMDESSKKQDFFQDNNAIRKIYYNENKIEELFLQHCLCWNKQRKLLQ